jgi:glutamate carboxypeptidase
VVNIPSPTENVPGVRAVGEVFRRELEAIGLRAHWVEMPPQMQRAGHLVAETGGTEGKRVLLLGHIDTVLSGERFRREGNKARGTGIDDMKGGVVVMVSALQALAAADALGSRRITVMLTGDEEDAGLPTTASRGPMLELAKQHDLVLSFESAIEGTATIGRRGAGSWTLEVTGETGHSSQIFGEKLGSGAVFEAARILDAFHRELGGERYLTFNPSLIVGGTTAALDGDYRGSAEGKTNVVAPQAVVRGDLRFISIEQEASARERMQAIVARHHPLTSATIRFDESMPAMTPTPGNEQLLAVLDAASRDLGQGAVPALDPGRRGAGDIGYVSHLLPGLDGLGIDGGGNAHAPGEYADLDTMVPMGQRAAVLLYRLTH